MAVNGLVESLVKSLRDDLVLGLVGSGFDPVSLFANGEQGAWYDPSDLTTLYQDAAGTTPVTADGDPVGLMYDRSPNDSDATQTTSAYRPVYTDDGTVKAVSPDSVDDYFTLGQALNFETFTCCVAVRLAGDNERTFDNRGTGGSGAVSGWQIKARNGISDWVTIDDGAGQYWQWDDDNSGASGQIRVMTLRYEPNSGLFRSNGVEIVPATTSSSMGSILSASGGTLFTAANSIGSQSFGGDFIGGLVINRALSISEIESLENYLAQKSGMTL